VGGQGGPYAVIEISGVRYELRRADRPDCWSVSRIGGHYEVWVEGGRWGCTCATAAFRTTRVCKHVSAVQRLRQLLASEG
jgi:hypothetical protein